MWVYMSDVSDKLEACSFKIHVWELCVMYVRDFFMFCSTSNITTDFILLINKIHRKFPRESIAISLHVLSHLLLFIKPSRLNRNPHKWECRMKAWFPHTNFATGSGWSHRFTMLTKRKLIGLKAVLHTVDRYTVDNRQWTFFVCEIWSYLSSLAYTLTSLLIPSHMQLTFNLCLCVVSGEKPAQEEKTGILCQHPSCLERRLASKVRHQNVLHGIGKPCRGDANCQIFIC